MSQTIQETISVTALIGVLVFAVVRPRGLPEALAAVPAALLVCVLGIVPWHVARHQVHTMAPTVIFRRPCQQVLVQGRTERVISEQAQQAQLLILARDGDLSRLGPSSLGHATRFVIDHAPCKVEVVWPEQAPSLSTMPPAPAGRRPDPGCTG